MSQSTMYFKGGQPHPGLSTEPTSFAGGHTTHTTESSPDQIGLHIPVQSRMISGSNVLGGNSIRPFTAANGPFHTAYDPFDFPPKLDQDRWPAPVSVCHACGNAIK